MDAELALRHVDPDLILCDIRMPGMDGLTFLEQIHKDHGKRMLFVFISGYSFRLCPQGTSLGRLRLLN
ncbi:response regulator [Paenibacillus vietnamensis]|uniref:response regulator n=1 Tax=Paenibacillus vietnamensis TaxID=2590547 RepID=UPI0037CA1373